MSARQVLFLKSAIFLLYYTFCGTEYVAAQPTGLHMFHTLSHGFNSSQVLQSPVSVSFDGMHGGYVEIHAELHPWERHRHHNGHGNHKQFNFVPAQPNFHDSGELNTNNVGNAAPYMFNRVAGPLEASDVNGELGEDTIIPHHPWHNPHGRRNHHRWHFGHRGRILDLDIHGGYEAGFGQNAIFEAGEPDSRGPQQTRGKEQMAEGARTTIETTTESAVEITEPTTGTDGTTTVSDSATKQTTDVTVTGTTEPTESKLAIDIRGGFS